MEALRALHERLRNEHLFVRKEIATIRRLHSEAQKLAEKVQHAARIGGDQQRILDAMESWGGVLTPADCARKIRDLELTRFGDARSKLGEGGELAMGELLNYVISRPAVLAEMLFICEKESVDVKGISSVVIYALYARSVTPDDEKTMTEVLHQLMLLQVNCNQNLRRFFRGDALAFSHLFRTWCLNLLSAKPFLKASLQPAIVEIVRDADESGCLEYDRIKAIQQLSEEERGLWYGGDQQEKSAISEKIQAQVGVAASRLASFCIIILQSLHEHLDVFPGSVRWLAAQFKAALAERGLVTDKAIYGLLTDMIFGNFICPILIDPQKHGIASELVITKEAKHNLTRISQILEDLSLIDLKLRDENLAKVHASMELANWRSFLNDLTTGVEKPIALPLLSSFGFQRTAVLATERELKILTCIVDRCMKSFVMCGQLAADSEKIKRILSKIPSDFKPSGIKVPLPATTTPEQFKSFPGQREGLSLLPHISTNRHTMPAARQLTARETEKNLPRHKSSFSSEINVDSQPFQSVSISESLSAAAIDSSPGRRHHTFSAAMMQRKQSVLAAADVLVIPLKVDCYTGQNVTNLQLKNEQQVVGGHTGSSTSLCSSAASTANTRSRSGSQAGGARKPEAKPPVDEVRRCASWSVLPQPHGSSNCLSISTVHTTAGDTAIAIDSLFSSTGSISTAGRPSSLPLNLNVELESQDQDFKVDSLLSNKAVQLDSMKSSLEALKDPESEQEGVIRDQLQVIQDSSIQVKSFEDTDSLGTVQFPQVTISLTHEVVNGITLSSATHNLHKNGPAVDMLKDFDPIHTHHAKSTPDYSNRDDSNQQGLLQQATQLARTSDSDELNHSLPGVTSEDSSHVSRVGSNSTENAVTTEQGPSLPVQQEKTRQRLFKKVSGSKIGRIFRRKQNPEVDITYASGSRSLSTSPNISPRPSPKSSPLSSPHTARRQDTTISQNETDSSVVSSTKSSAGDLIVLGPSEQDVIKEEDEDITLKYQRKMEELRRQKELDSLVDSDEDESCSDLGDIDDPLVAFGDAKQQLRTVFSSFDSWPLVGQTQSSYTAIPSETEKPAELQKLLGDERGLQNKSDSKYYNCDVRWLLQLWLAEAYEDQEQVQVASLREALRAFDLLPSDKQVDVLDQLEDDYHQRVSYIAYLTRTKQSLLRAVAMMDRELKRIKECGVLT
jgi:hypothetical protein